MRAKAAPAAASSLPALEIAALFATALGHHRAGQLTQAESSYLKLLAIDASHVDSLHLLGVIAYQTGHSDRALDLIGRAIELNGENPAFHNNIGLALDALGRAGDAVIHYRRALILKPDYMDAYNNLGAALLAQGKVLDAVDCYRRAVALRPDFAEGHNNLGNALKRLGKLDEAVGRYQQALALRSDFAEAHNNLGNALTQQGRPAEAAAQYRRALALRPDYVEVHYHLGNASRDQGRLDEAEVCYRQALSLNPGYTAAHNNLGAVLKERGQIEDAVVHLRRALAIDPKFAEAHNNLGNVYREQGRIDDALAHYREAVALQHDFAEAHNNLGTVFHEQGGLHEAMSQYYRVLELDPGHAEAHGNLGRALMDAGAFADALTVIRRGLKIEETDNLKLLFVGCVRNLDRVPEGMDLRADLIRALSEPFGRPVYLARFCATALKSDGTVRAMIDRIAGAWPRRIAAAELWSDSEFAEISSDRLLQCFLTSSLVCDIELERLFTVIRAALLQAAAGGSGVPLPDQGALEFFCALARQCFINEYVFEPTDDEMATANRLRASAAETLTSRAALPELALVAVAAYFPLADLPGADLIPLRPWSAPVATLVAHAVEARQQERRLRAVVPRLTAIAEGVSGLVRQQYEENPYPRWTKASPVGKPVTIDAYLRRRFPLLPRRSTARDGAAEILVAGCGTGQHSIETAQEFTHAQVLAVDLSLESLCYARRKTDELGLTNIEYAHADILKLPALGRSFDLIEACGSLQCMADQFDAWRLLLSMVRPGAFMRLGLYSRTARADINDARRLIAERGYRPCAEDIRRFRQELAGAGNDNARRPATDSEDFYSTSACRDLLFHVQEHQATLPEIKTFIERHELEFLGFELPRHVERHFRERFPDVMSMTDLDLWHVFETENPLVFAGMYEFWIAKP